MARRDRMLLEALRSFLGVGSVHAAPARRHWQPVSTFSVNSHHAHRIATIPFAEMFLRPSAKRRQFEQWRAQLDAHESRHPNPYGRGPSPCSVEGCGAPVRGRGLCRSHYYRETGY
jgi:hypothetical protein